MFDDTYREYAFFNLELFSSGKMSLMFIPDTRGNLQA